MHILIESGEQASRLWDLVPVVIGAIIGAASGAIPSYLLANRSAREQKERDQVERARLDKTSARAAAFKLQKIVNGLATMNSQINEMIFAAEEAGCPDDEIWKRFLPIGGIAPERVAFETAELALVYEAGESLLANQMMLVADRHYAADLAMLEYSARRRALHDLVGEGNAERRTEDEVFLQRQPLIAELSNAAAQIRDMYRKDQPVAVDVFRRYTEAMQKLFKSPEFLKLKIVEPVLD